MAGKYAPDEIFEMAVKIEKDGEKFYGYLAKNLENPGKKELFPYLQLQEAQHAKDFEKISRDLVDEIDPSMWEDAKFYLQHLVDGKIFPTSDEMISKSKYMSLDQIIDFALSIEKETVIFYNEILDSTKSEKTQEILKKIIHEELGHIERFMKIKGEA
uniref:Ferritin n=1 Tax=Mesoaciditoga lauensis TaxID=1495039 RepID=A0A7V3RFA4_9BACT